MSTIKVDTIQTVGSGNITESNAFSNNIVSDANIALVLVHQNLLVLPP